MGSPQHLNISDFTYVLPKEKIAAHPIAQRDAAKLLIYSGGNISESTFMHLPEYLPLNSLLIFNNTRVIPARMLFQKNSGSGIEIFVLEPFETGILPITLQQVGSIDYLCLIKGAAKWKSGPLVKIKDFNGIEITLEATLIEKKTDAFQVHFSWQPAYFSFAKILQIFGEMPIPPYLHRQADHDDKHRYQTIYAMIDGSVAAPTAGLHFTDDVMQSLIRKKILIAYTTLHVGVGTFRPVKSETLADHEMHAEWITIEKNLLEKLLLQKQVIPVGTTSLRTVESIYWLGLKAFQTPQIRLENMHINQWEVYTNNQDINVTADDAINALIKWMDEKALTQFITRTQILIAPGYTFRVCKGLITNFHQPQSTLLLLIAALVGNDWKNIYEYALKNEFRFLSYGDSSLLLPGNNEL